jgi:hypothetical protein
MMAVILRDLLCSHFRDDGRERPPSIPFLFRYFSIAVS